MLFERIQASGLGLVIGSIGDNRVNNITFRDTIMHNTFKVLSVSILCARVFFPSRAALTSFHPSPPNEGYLHEDTMERPRSGRRYVTFSLDALECSISDPVAFFAVLY